MKHIFLSLILFILSACNDNLVEIDADDFGFPKVNVSASGLNISGTQANELSQWTSSGYEYDGNGNIVIMVYNNSGGVTSAWTSWYGANEATITPSMIGASNCQITPPQTGDTSVTFTAPSTAPCIFTQGQGLYLLLTDPNNTQITDPNSNTIINRTPSTANFLTMQLNNPIAMYNNGSPAYGYLGNFPNSENYVGGEAYFKILDKYYDDNSGGYYVALKDGFTPLQKPPITAVVNIVTNALNNTSMVLFNSIVSNSQYMSALRAAMVLYIIVMGILFLGGSLHMTEKELVVMLFKLVLVMQLVTTTASWTFFNQYFFQIFTSGVVEITNIITANFTGGAVGSLTFFDQFISLMYSYETWIKIMALIISVPTGFFAALIITVGFFTLTFAIAQAVMIYLLALIATSLLIMLGPIFIPLIMFNRTKSMFEKWIDQLAMYFFQPLLVFASINLLGQIAISYIYKLLGFAACFQNWIVLFGDWVLAKNWMICPISFGSSTPVSMAVPGFGFWDSGNPNYFCNPYECTADRYIDLPFLDPVADASLIKDFQNPWVSLSTPMVYNSCIFTLICYVMVKFNSLIAEIARMIARQQTHGSNALVGAATSSVNSMYGAASWVGGKAFTAAGLANQILYERITGRPYEENPIKQGISYAQRGLAGKINSLYEKYDELENMKYSPLKLMKRIIPPLSIEMKTAEEEQNERWKEAKEKGETFERSFAKPFETAQHAVQDTIGDGLERGYNRMANPGATKKYDNNIGVWGSAKAFGGYAAGNIGYAAAKLSGREVGERPGYESYANSVRNEYAQQRAVKGVSRMGINSPSMSAIDIENNRIENLAILKSLLPKEDQNSPLLHTPDGIEELLRKLPADKVARMRELMNNPNSEE